MNSSRYLGSITDDKLYVNENIEKVYKKPINVTGMYFVKKLKKYNIDKSIVSVFYKSVVESLLNFGLLNWYGGS